MREVLIKQWEKPRLLDTLDQPLLKNAIRLEFDVRNHEWSVVIYE